MDHRLPVERTHIHHDYVPPRGLGRLQALAAALITRDRWARSHMLAHQRERLRATIHHAVTHSEYYCEVIGNVPDVGLSLESLPTLTKQTLMANWDRIVTDPHLRLSDAEMHLASPHASELLFGEYQVVASGGTTGVQGVIVYDRPAWEIAIASIQRAMAIQEISPMARVIGIGSPTPLHMTYRLFSALHQGHSAVPRIALTTPMPEVVDSLNAYQPDAVVTYPSFIRRLAEEQKAGRLRISPKKFCSTAETLTQDVRDLAQETWDARVLNVYGATEVNLMGAECPWTSGLHVPEDLIVLEIVDEANRPVPPGVVGHKILVTTLYNRTLPLIRYEISDLLAVADGTCPCGRPHLRIASVQGRREELLKLSARDGGHVDVHALHLHALLTRIPAVRQIEIIPQFENVLIRVALKQQSGTVDVLRRVQATLEDEFQRLGSTASVTIEAVDEIARSGNGAKQKLVRKPA